MIQPHPKDQRVIQIRMFRITEPWCIDLNFYALREMRQRSRFIPYISRKGGLQPFPDPEILVKM